MKGGEQTQMGGEKTGRVVGGEVEELPLHNRGDE